MKGGALWEQWCIMGRMVHYGKCGELWDMEDDACWDMMWPRDSPEEAGRGLMTKIV